MCSASHVHGAISNSVGGDPHRAEKHRCKIMSKLPHPQSNSIEVHQVASSQLCLHADLVPVATKALVAPPPGVSLWLQRMHAVN